MKKRTGLALLLAVVSSSATAEWVEVNSNAMLNAYADPSTIVREGNRARFWVLFDLRTASQFVGKPYLSSRLQNEFDCAEQQYRTLVSSFHSGSMAEGVVISARSYVREWQSVPPGGIVESLWILACGKQAVLSQGAAVERAAAAPTPVESTSSFTAVAAFVDAKRVFDALRGRYRDDQAFLDAVNPKLQKFIEENNLDIVFQKAVWASAGIDITDEFIREVEGKSVDYERLRNLSRIRPKVGLVDMDRIRQELIARRSVASARVLDTANRVTRQIAEAQDFTLVVQQAAYASPGIDITSAVIQRLP